MEIVRYCIDYSILLIHLLNIAVVELLTWELDES